MISGIVGPTGSPFGRATLKLVHATQQIQCGQPVFGV